MGISKGSQALTHVVNDPFADLKGNFVFDNVVVFPVQCKNTPSTCA